MSKENNLHDFLTDLADGIRTVEGSTDPINPQDFRNRIEGLGGGGDETLNALIDGTITEINSGIGEVGSYAFYKRTALKSVSFPNATTIGGGAFCDCTALTSLSFPNVQRLLDGTITGSGNSAIYYGAFSRCAALTSVSFPNLTSIGSYTFSNCTALTSVSFPNVTSVNSNAFASCTALTTVSFPNATTVPYAFYSCTALTTGIFPNATSVSSSAFNKAYQLTKVIVGTNLTTVATLANTNAFNNCYHFLGTSNSMYNPTGAKDGYIYVPLSLVDSYRTATYWTTYASQIMPYVATVAELSNIDGTTYDKACVGAYYTEYTYNGTTWELYVRS